MGIFDKTYNKCKRAAAHPHAPKVLCVMSFAESSFFPIPPDVLLAPMALSKPQKALWFAFLCTLFSVLGGLLGYLIGFFAFDSVSELLRSSGYLSTYLETRQWFEKWGVWLVFVAGFSPIPYKLFTLTAGVMAQPLMLFVIASFIGRGARFFLVAGLLKYFGTQIEPVIVRYVEWLGWLFVGLLLLAVIVL